MRFKKIFIVLLIGVAIAAGGCTLWRGSQEPSQQEIERLGYTPNPELERAYEQQLKTILAPYWQGAGFAGIRDQILEIRTPGKYLDLHLNLVLAFGLLEDGTSQNDQTKITDATNRINALADQYSWLK